MLVSKLNTVSMVTGILAGRMGLESILTTSLSTKHGNFEWLSLCQTVHVKRPSSFRFRVLCVPPPLQRYGDWTRRIVHYMVLRTCCLGSNHSRKPEPDDGTSLSQRHLLVVRHWNNQQQLKCDSKICFTAWKCWHVKHVSISLREWFGLVVLILLN